jgi:hypothetical protein
MSSSLAAKVMLDQVHTGTNVTDVLPARLRLLVTLLQVQDNMLTSGTGVWSMVPINGASATLTITIQ